MGVCPSSPAAAILTSHRSAGASISVTRSSARFQHASATPAVVAEQSPECLGANLRVQPRLRILGTDARRCPLPSPSPFVARAITSQAIYKDAGDDAMTTRLSLLRCKIRIGGGDKPCIAFAWNQDGVRMFHGCPAPLWNSRGFNGNERPEVDAASGAVEAS